MAPEGSDREPHAESFTSLYRRWRNVVKREASYLCSCDADAEDVVQIVFLRLWESRSWHVVRHPDAYFQTAARREALRMNLVRRTVRIDEVQILDPSRGPLELAVTNEAQAVIREAIETLPPRCAEVMTLTILTLCSARQIAEQLDVSVGAVGKQRTRGWHLLRQWFDARGGAEVWISSFR